MDGIADMGGAPGWGTMHPPRQDEPVFAEPWESRAFALAILSNRVSGETWTPSGTRWSAWTERTTSTTATTGAGSTPES